MVDGPQSDSCILDHCCPTNCDCIMHPVQGYKGLYQRSLQTRHENQSPHLEQSVPCPLCPARVLREKDRMREYEITQLPIFDPLTPALSLREREFVGQQ